MSVAYDRSMNAELTNGVTDGKVRKANPNRGGIEEPTTNVARASLPFGEYGFQSQTGEATRPDSQESLPGPLPVSYPTNL